MQCLSPVNNDVPGSRVPQVLQQRSMVSSRVHSSGMRMRQDFASDSKRTSRYFTKLSSSNLRFPGWNGLTSAKTGPSSLRNEDGLYILCGVHVCLTGCSPSGMAVKILNWGHSQECIAGHA